MAMTTIVLKTCSKCGKSFSSGKYGSLGYEFWWTWLTVIGGIVYYFLRHKERCPFCNSTEIVARTIDIKIP